MQKDPDQGGWNENVFSLIFYFLKFAKEPTFLVLPEMQQGVQ